MELLPEIPSTSEIIADISEAGIAFIAQFEAFVPHMYTDDGGFCTVGIGHLIKYSPCDGTGDEIPYLDGITEQQAYDLMRIDLNEAIASVMYNIDIALTQHQFDALVSLAYNIGGLAGTKVAFLINQGDFAGAAVAWREQSLTAYGSDEVLPGLVRRRDYEATLFTTGEYRDDF